MGVRLMFVAIRYMEEEAHAIAEAIGGFDSEAKAWAFIEKHWTDYDQNMIEAFELSSPDGYGE
jgi:hypothetical protein